MPAKLLKPERLEELRQMAGGIDGPKSEWMDELIDHIDALQAERDVMREALQSARPVVNDAYCDVGPPWQKATRKEILDRVDAALNDSPHRLHTEENP